MPQGFDDQAWVYVMNATTKAAGTEGGYYLAKRRAGKTMDAAMAAMNVVYGTIHEPDAAHEVSIYDRCPPWWPAGASC